MEESKKEDSSFLLGLSITLGTIVIGLISYIVYSENMSPTKSVCEYNGWAYSDKESFKSSDGCNQCLCNDGEVVCTEIACTDDPSSNN